MGYQEGGNIVIDYHYADGDPARLADLAAAAVALHPDVIVTAGGLATTALAEATSTIPIVTVNGDPVGLGFAASLAHPGGNITGLSVYVSCELAGKLIQLLREMRQTRDASRCWLRACPPRWPSARLRRCVLLRSTQAPASLSSSI